MAPLTSNLVKLLSVVLIVALVGCNEPLKKCEQDLAGANSRIKDLQSQWDQAERARQAAEDEAAALKADRDRLKADLAKALAPAPGWNNVPGGAMISIDAKILFDSGKADLLKEGGPTLDKVAATIKQKFAKHEIWVQGHTDNEPIEKSGWKDNYELSCQRSLTVLRHLKKEGVGNDVVACGWGDSRPVVQNTTKESMAANRRVEIFAMDPASRRR